jgi:hypothetical protein
MAGKLLKLKLSIDFSILVRGMHSWPVQCCGLDSMSGRFPPK